MLKLEAMTAGFHRRIIITTALSRTVEVRCVIQIRVSRARIYQRCDVSTVQIKWG